MPPVLPDRLYLVYAAGFPVIRNVFDGLRSMAFYHFDPAAMKTFQPTDAGDVLRADGSNIASVLSRLQTSQPDLATRIQGYLSTVVPDITAVSVAQSNGQSALRFSQRVHGSTAPWNFPAVLMSNGTLGAFGALVAVNQHSVGPLGPRLVGIEEPETALHPAASAALMDALREASTHTQVVVTTHSPDLLDRVNPDVEQLLVLQSVEGRTEIAPVDAASRESIKSHLYSPGELLRMDQLQPDALDLQRQSQLLANSETVP
jgi:predicted ATPase